MRRGKGFSLSADLLAILLLLAPASGQPLQQRVEALIRSSPAAQRAFWGIKVVDPADGRVLAALNAGRFFRPASNTKLFTTALALMRLGPDWTFNTTVTATPSGDLVLAGGGDPTLSARAVPYRRGPVTGDPLQALEALADQVVAHGIREVKGDIIGDDTIWPWEPYPEGWTADDTVWLYGAPVSALEVNDGSFRLTLAPAAVPDLPPSITLSPPVEYFTIDNRVRWGAGLERKIRVERSGGQLRLTGTMPAQPVHLDLAVDDPAFYAAYAFTDALARRGVVIRGRPAARHRAAGQPYLPVQGKELARRTSPPLLEVLRTINKISQNLHVEMVLREVGRVRRGSGSLEAGIEERKAFLAQAGIPDTEYDLDDASGLARQNLVTPDAVARLLVYMYGTQYREAWLSLLPIGGEDGTLEDRFDKQSAARAIHAKTGTLTAVSGLSGYAERRRGGPVVFSILVNNYHGQSREIRGVMDKIALLIAGS